MTQENKLQRIDYLTDELAKEVEKTRFVAYFSDKSRG